MCSLAPGNFPASAARNNRKLAALWVPGRGWLNCRSRTQWHARQPSVRKAQLFTYVEDEYHLLLSACVGKQLENSLNVTNPFG